MASGRSSRPGFVLAVLVLSALTLVAVADRVGGPSSRLRRLATDVMSPVRSVGSAVASPFGDMFGGLTNYREVRDENRRLTKELAETKAIVLSNPDAVRELNEILDLAGFENTGNIPSVDARVIGHTPSNFDGSVEIDKGSTSGLREGMPVVSGKGLIGRVQSVSRQRAVISLITAPGNQIGVRLSTSGEVGLARADRSGRITVDIIEPGTTISKGEVLVTTGFQNSRYPDRIVVGRVRSASMSPGDLQVQVVIDPVVDPGRLSYVKVLRWTEGRGSEAASDAGDSSVPRRTVPPTTTQATTTQATTRATDVTGSPGTASAPAPFVTAPSDTAPSDTVSRP